MKNDSKNFEMMVLSGQTTCGNCGRIIEGNGVNPHWLHSKNTGWYYCGRCLIDVRKELQKGK